MEMRQLFLSFSIALQVLITFQAICATCRSPPPERMRHQSVIVAKWEETGNRWPVFGTFFFSLEKRKNKVVGRGVLDGLVRLMEGIASPGGVCCHWSTAGEVDGRKCSWRKSTRNQ
jgi:hypothetical protein